MASEVAVFKYLFVCVFAVLLTSTIGGPDKNLLAECNSKCAKGGCLGKAWLCRNVCYCFGSGFEDRCKQCMTRTPKPPPPKQSEAERCRKIWQEMEAKKEDKKTTQTTN